ncbi:hypothetical protein JCM5353_001252 [Sporobolomyces roseus]
MPTRSSRRDRRQRALSSSTSPLDLAISRPVTARNFHRPTYLSGLSTWPYNPISLAPQAFYHCVHPFYKYEGTFEAWNGQFEVLLAELYAISKPFHDRPDQDYLFFPTDSCEAMMQYVKASIAVHTQLLMKLDGIWEKATARWKGMDRDERRKMLLDLFKARRDAVEVSDDAYDYRRVFHFSTVFEFRNPRAHAFSR